MTKEFISFGDDTQEQTESIVGQNTDDQSSTWMVAELPSAGRAGYPAKVYYRNLIGRDEKMIASASAKNFKTVVEDVLKGLLRDKTAFEKLTVHDRDFLLIWVWANCYSTTRSVRIECEHCSHSDSFDVDLTKVPVKNLDERYVTPFSFTLTTGEKVTMRLATVGDERKAAIFVQNNPTYEQDMVELAMSVTFSKVMNIKDKIAYMEELSARDNAYLRTFHEFFAYGLARTLEHTCTSCGEVTHYGLPFHTRDFLPTVSRDFGALLPPPKRAEPESDSSGSDGSA